MKIYHVDFIDAYGSSGTIVLAESEERAIELFRESSINAGEGTSLTATLLSEKADKEFVCPEFVW